ncbi:hypothetical protein GCM10027589_58210 [Actinocorallia lasiicapitis]
MLGRRGRAAVGMETDELGARPGGLVTGVARVVGEPRAVVIGLETDAEGERRLSGPFVPGMADKEFGFVLYVPWEAPVTELWGREVHRVEAVARIPGGAERRRPVVVHPAPVQMRMLAALRNLGFVFDEARCAAGTIQGVLQELPFYQEFLFRPPRRFARAMSAVTATFVANPRTTELLLEVDGPGCYGHGRFTLPTTGFERTDWELALDTFFREV